MGTLNTSPGPVFKRIVDLLDAHEIDYRVVEHGVTRTSEDSARARGEALNIGAKAIVMKTGDSFAVFVLSAATRIDGRRLRRQLGVKRTRFASGEELQELTGLPSGAVPPFGRPVLDLPVYVDPILLEESRMAFNAGSLTDSIIMSTEDYVRVASPTVFPFADSDG